MERRTFLRGAGATGLALGLGAAGWPGRALADSGRTLPGPGFDGRRVIIVRFGGGVRRREVIGDDSWAPFLEHELIGRGTLYPNMVIEQQEGLATSHGQGTLNILTGRYDRYRDVEDAFLRERFEAKVPTVFEGLRKGFDVPESQALIINGEDRTNEEFYSFSNHHQYGVRYRSRTLSLYRFKTWLLRRRLAVGDVPGAERPALERRLAELEDLDYRSRGREPSTPELDAFWESWRAHHGESGLKHPRGDALLTELAVRALRQLRPKLLIVNYQDTDYVHWGNRHHYTWGIQVIDRGLRRLVESVEADEGYRDRTVFVVVPDCGRDANPFAPVPYQHHFNSRSSHEIFALVFGAGVPKGQVVDRVVQQTAVAGTIGAVMGFPMPHAESDLLAEALG